MKTGCTFFSAIDPYHCSHFGDRLVATHAASHATHIYIMNWYGSKSMKPNPSHSSFKLALGCSFQHQLETAKFLCRTLTWYDTAIRFVLLRFGSRERWSTQWKEPR
eukprot:5811143-Amphidinium_carterae.1